MDVIGMTNLQEAKLAREAEICYATVAMVTDFDCWHPDHDAVTVQQIVQNLLTNADNAAKVLMNALEVVPRARGCRCGSALENAILTDRTKIPAETRRKLDKIIGKYLAQ
jgi:5'-methylthioadenosine phosphorylase